MLIIGEENLAFFRVALIESIKTHNIMIVEFLIIPKGVNLV